MRLFKMIILQSLVDVGIDLFAGNGINFFVDNEEKLLSHGYLFGNDFFQDDLLGGVCDASDSGSCEVCDCDKTHGCMCTLLCRQ